MIPIRHVIRFSSLDHTQLLSGSCFGDTMATLWECPRNALSLFSLLIPTTYALDMFPPPTHISFSPARMMELFASEILVQANVSLSWAQFRRDPVLALFLPVEQVLICPSGGDVCLIRRGFYPRSMGPCCRWAVPSCMSNHQKTVTSLAFHANISRQLTGGLDHMVTA